MGLQATEPPPPRAVQPEDGAGPRAAECVAGASPSRSLGLLSCGAGKGVSPRVAGELTQTPCALSRCDCWEHPHPRACGAAPPESLASLNHEPGRAFYLCRQRGTWGRDSQRDRSGCQQDMVRSLSGWLRLTPAPWTGPRTQLLPRKLKCLRGTFASPLEWTFPVFASLITSGCFY